MVGAPEGDSGVRGRGTVLAVVRVSAWFPPSEQDKAIEEYVRKKGLGERIHRVEITDVSHLRLLYGVAKTLGARVVVVHSWTVLGGNCRLLAVSLSALFGAGVEEIHQAADGSVLTREDWERHKGFLARFALAPQYAERGKVDLMLALKVLDAAPESMEEALDIYNILAAKTRRPPVHLYHYVIRAMTEAALVASEAYGVKMPEEIEEMLLRDARKIGRRKRSRRASRP